MWSYDLFKADLVSLSPYKLADYHKKLNKVVVHLLLKGFDDFGVLLKVAMYRTHYPNLKKRSGSGSDRILILKKYLDPVPAGS